MVDKESSGSSKKSFFKFVAIFAIISVTLPSNHVGGGCVACSTDMLSAPPFLGVWGMPAAFWYLKRSISQFAVCDTLRSVKV